MLILRFAALFSAALLAAQTRAIVPDGFKEGEVALQSAGPIAFGPEGILFIADTKAAAIVALDTADTKASHGKDLKVEGIDKKVAALLGTASDQILINDMVVNPLSHNVYLAISRGRGPDAKPVLVRVKSDGQLEMVSLAKARYARADGARASGLRSTRNGGGSWRGGHGGWWRSWWERWGWRRRRRRSSRSGCRFSASEKSGIAWGQDASPRAIGN